MRVQVTHGIDDLAGDLRRIATTTRPKVSRIVRKNAEQGNRLAKSIARKSAGAHGVHYPKAFTAEMLTPLMAEYGPDASMPQGGMSFEYGSRNQPPHMDLNKSADVQGPKLAKDIDDLMDGLFW